MKKIILLVFATVVMMSCDQYAHQEKKITGNSPYNVFVEHVEGHKYVIVTMDRLYGAGVSVVHAESCDCKQH